MAGVRMRLIMLRSWAIGHGETYDPRLAEDEEWRQTPCAT